MSDFKQPGSPDDPDQALIDILEADKRRVRIRERADVEIEKREGRRLADALERQDDREPVIRSLFEQLKQPLNEQLYAIEELLPLGGNALFAGRYKAGKTTINGQLLKSWADGGPFMGKFPVHRDPDRPNVTIFNYEMSEDQCQRWLTKIGISKEGQKRVHLVHLRGMPLPLALPETREKVAGWLRDRGTGLWIVDPASRAMAGMGDGDSNADVGMFVSWLDSIKLDAGVRDMVLNIHMGHAAAADKNAERAIGAQAWSAWADALWFLTKKDDNGVESRWFRADGRDVNLKELLINYDKETMGVTLIETDPEAIKRDSVRIAILTHIEHNPGCSVRSIRDGIPHIVKASVKEIDWTTRKLVEQGEIITRPGARKSIMHYLAGTQDLLTDPV